MVKITVLLKDLDDFKEMNELLGDFLGDCAVLPVRTTLQPAQMPLGSRSTTTRLLIVFFPGPMFALVIFSPPFHFQDRN